MFIVTATIMLGIRVILKVEVIASLEVMISDREIFTVRIRFNIIIIINRKMKICIRITDPDINID